MSTTESIGRRAAPVLDGKLAKHAVLASGAVPGLLLAWDAYRGNLGVNEVNFAIRTTGLVGLVFMTLALAITPLRRLTGWNGLLAARRNLGVYGFLYIAAHFTIFFLYDRDASVSSTLSEVVERVYLWFGAGALAIMIPLAITSTDAMVTRLGPRRWKLLHRLAYVAVLFGVIHYYLLVKADTTKPFAFAVVFGALMAFRIGRHYLDLRGEVKAAKAKLQAARSATAKPKKFWSGQLVVARVFDETEDVKTFRLVSPDGGPLPFRPVAGQYLNLRLVIDGKRVNRSYTIASSPARDASCEITVKRDGVASRFLHASVREGTRLDVAAPAGKFVFADGEADRVVLVAGGVGITPMMAVIRDLTDRCWRGEIYLLFSVRRRGDVIFEQELAYLQRRFPNLHVEITLTGDPEAAWDGARGHLSRELVEAFVPDARRGPVMLCGPEQMMAAMRALFTAIGVPDRDVHEEAFVSRPSGDAAAAGEDPAPSEPASDDARIRFERAGKTAEAMGLTVLEAAEEHDVAIPFECRSGICGQCKCKLVSGRVAMEVQDALTAGDRRNGLILACQARPVSDVVVDL